MLKADLRPAREMPPVQESPEEARQRRADILLAIARDCGWANVEQMRDGVRRVLRRG